MISDSSTFVNEELVYETLLPSEGRLRPLSYLKETNCRKAGVTLAEAREFRHSSWTFCENRGLLVTCFRPWFNSPVISSVNLCYLRALWLVSLEQTQHTRRRWVPHDRADTGVRQRSGQTAVPSKSHPQDFKMFNNLFSLMGSTEPLSIKRIKQQHKKKPANE